MDARTLIERQVAEHERLRRCDRTDIRQRSFAERSELIKAACRSAAAVRRSRILSGLPDVQPSPWPESTWELFRKYAPNGRRADSGK